MYLQTLLLITLAAHAINACEQTKCAEVAGLCRSLKLGVSGDTARGCCTESEDRCKKATGNACNNINENFKLAAETCTCVKQRTATMKNLEKAGKPVPKHMGPGYCPSISQF